MEKDIEKEEFLEEYRQLCIHYGYEIRGCGDCGSAWLQELSEEAKKYEKLCWKDDFKEICFCRKI
jgi:hypothetical protein